MSPMSASTASDVIELDQLLSAALYATDSNRIAEHLEAFTDDAEIEMVWIDDAGELHPMNDGQGVRYQGKARLELFIRTLLGDPPPLPRRKGGLGHLFVNRVITVDGDTARIHTTSVTGASQYEIDAVRTPDGWRFRRQVVILNEHRRLPTV